MDVIFCIDDVTECSVSPLNRSIYCMSAGPRPNTQKKPDPFAGPGRWVLYGLV